MAVFIYSIIMLLELVSSPSMFAEIPDSQDPWSELSVIMRASVEIADSEDFWSEFSTFHSPPKGNPRQPDLCNGCCKFHLNIDS